MFFFYSSVEELVDTDHEDNVTKENGTLLNEIANYTLTFFKTIRASYVLLLISLFFSHEMCINKIFNCFHFLFTKFNLKYRLTFQYI